MTELPTPPQRPTDLSPKQLGYVHEKPVSWLSPPLLLGTAVRVLGASFFGEYLDKRELQNALPSEVYDHSDECASDGDFWFDFVADLGDGFNGTYSLAWLLAQPALIPAAASSSPSAASVPSVPSVPAPDQALPRGRVLVMGGDEVYPTPSWDAYESRMRGPYRSALPVATDDSPTLYALPGNHDWYDGLTAFLRLFAKDGFIGGWRTRQSRSYFALRLPNRWWLFALDSQLSAYIDNPQLQYFERAAANLGPGDNVVLCVAQPAWVETPTTPSAYDSTDYFLRRIIRPTGARCSVLLTGDLHHYARYEKVPAVPAADFHRTEKTTVDDLETTPPRTPDGVREKVSDSGDDDTGPHDGAESPATAPEQLITCGGGGAFLSDTEHLPDDLHIPSPSSMARRTSPVKHYRLKSRFPSADGSRAYSFGVFTRLLPRNTGFALLMGILHVLLLVAFLSSQRQVLTAGSVGMSALVFLGAIALAAPKHGGSALRVALHRAVGFLHGVGHIALGLLGTALWLTLPFSGLWWPWQVLTAVALYGPVFGFLGTELVALYFMIAGRFGINLNELFAAQGIEDSKSFLRIKISGTDGSLTVYPIGVDKVCHFWKAAPADPAESPWIAPQEELRPKLLESPIRIERN